MRERLTIGFVLFSDAVALNLHGPAEVFSRANQILKTRSAAYKLLYLSESGGSIRTSSGVVMETQAVNSIEGNCVATLIVGGGLRAAAFISNSPLILWFKDASR